MPRKAISTGNPKQSAGTVPGARKRPVSDERRALRQCWRDHRKQGAGAIAAAIAERLAVDRIAERSSCAVSDPVAEARALVADGARRGWLSRAA